MLGAQGRTRTGTSLPAHNILSVVCLPVSPPGRRATSLHRTVRGDESRRGGEVAGQGVADPLPWRDGSGLRAGGSSSPAGADGWAGGGGWAAGGGLISGVSGRPDQPGGAGRGWLPGGPGGEGPGGGGLTSGVPGAGGGGWRVG